MYFSLTIGCFSSLLNDCRSFGIGHIILCTLGGREILGCTFVHFDTIDNARFCLFLFMIDSMSLLNALSDIGGIFFFLFVELWPCVDTPPSEVDFT